MHIGFVFPGEGAQRPGMLHRLPDTPASATVLAEADWALRTLVERTAAVSARAGRLLGGAGAAERDAVEPQHVDGIAELDTAESLERSAVARHLALFIAGVAGARALTEDEQVRPALVAGQDAGGYAAAVAAGVLTFEEGLRAVRLRGALLGAGREPAPDVAVLLAQHLATVKRRPQELPYVSGVHGRCLRSDTNAVLDDLAYSVTRPASWPAMAAALAAEGTECCVELPPGRALAARLAGAAPPVAGLRVVSVEEHGIAVAARLARGEPAEAADPYATDPYDDGAYAGDPHAGGQAAELGSPQPDASAAGTGGGQSGLA